MSDQKKDLRYYKRLPYTLRTEPARDSDGTTYWLAQFEELPGCKTDGATEGDAINNLHELFDEFISSAIADRLPIKEPLTSVAVINPITVYFERVTEKTEAAAPAEVIDAEAVVA